MLHGVCEGLAPSVLLPLVEVASAVHFPPFPRHPCVCPHSDRFTIGAREMETHDAGTSWWPMQTRKGAGVMLPALGTVHGLAATGYCSFPGVEGEGDQHTRSARWTLYCKWSTLTKHTRIQATLQWLPAFSYAVC